MNILTAIKYLKKKVLYPSKGLPDDLFYYVSSITPMINVDILIKNWREVRIRKFNTDGPWKLYKPFREYKENSPDLLIAENPSKT